jgi:tRNA(Ile2) C34 agmatinyltransferase TiaS
MGDRERQERLESLDEMLDKSYIIPDTICPQCFGEGHYLGSLGALAHYRCRYCGWTYAEGHTDVTATEN